MSGPAINSFPFVPLNFWVSKTAYATSGSHTAPIPVDLVVFQNLVSFANTTSAPSAVLDSHVHGKLGQEDKVGPRISFWGGNVGWGGPGKLVGEGTQYATTTGHFDATEPVVEAEV